MTLEQVIEFLKMPKDQVENLARKGDLSASLILGKWRFSRSSVESWGDRAKARGAAPVAAKAIDPTMRVGGATAQAVTGGLEKLKGQVLGLEEAAGILGVTIERVEALAKNGLLGGSQSATTGKWSFHATAVQMYLEKSGSKSSPITAKWAVPSRRAGGTGTAQLKGLEEQVKSTSQLLMDNGLVKSGERYVMVYGARVGVRGATNAVRVEQLP